MAEVEEEDVRAPQSVPLAVVWYSTVPGEPEPAGLGTSVIVL